jgi:hypothetical protein
MNRLSCNPAFPVVEILFFIALVVSAISFMVKQRVKIREWFGSVLNLLFLLLLVFGTYGAWRDYLMMTTMRPWGARQENDESCSPAF